ELALHDHVQENDAGDNVVVEIEVGEAQERAAYGIRHEAQSKHGTVFRGPGDPRISTDPPLHLADGQKARNHETEEQDQPDESVLAQHLEIDAVRIQRFIGVPPVAEELIPREDMESPSSEWAVFRDADRESPGLKASHRGFILLVGLDRLHPVVPL